MKQYIFRLDDISWDMNYENFCRIRDIFFRYDVKPIIGIIPHNEDEKLMEQVGVNHLKEEEFWPIIRDLQRNHGWAVALHGYHHVYATHNGGILKVNDRSEFAGLPLAEQSEKIRRGKDILEQNGLRIDAFMAPAHTYDWNTVSALLQNGIGVMTDGYAPYPYRKKGMLFIPQIWPWPSRLSCGIDTSTFHINAWDPHKFEMLDDFIQSHLAEMTTFQKAVSDYADSTGVLQSLQAVLFSVGVPLYRKIRPRFSGAAHQGGRDGK